MQKAGVVGAKGCPDIAIVINRTKYCKGQLGVKLAMLVDQVVAQDTFANFGHTFIEPDQLLQLDFALVPRTVGVGARRGEFYGGR
jgi:hypothetical protein